MPLSLQNRFLIEAKNKPKSKARYAVFNVGDIVLAKIELRSTRGASSGGNYSPTISLYKDMGGELESVCSVSYNEFFAAFGDIEDDINAPIPGTYWTPPAPVYSVRSITED